MSRVVQQRDSRRSNKPKSLASCGEWAIYKSTSQQRYFYFNTGTGSAQWEKPLQWTIKPDIQDLLNRDKERQKEKLKEELNSTTSAPTDSTLRPSNGLSHHRVPSGTACVGTGATSSSQLPGKLAPATRVNGLQRHSQPSTPLPHFFDSSEPPRQKAAGSSAVSYRQQNGSGGSTTHSTSPMSLDESSRHSEGQSRSSEVRKPSPEDEALSQCLQHTDSVLLELHSRLSSGDSGTPSEQPQLIRQAERLADERLNWRLCEEQTRGDLLLAQSHLRASHLLRSLNDHRILFTDGHISDLVTRDRSYAHFTQSSDFA